MDKSMIKRFIPPIIFEKTAELNVFLHRRDCNPFPITQSEKNAIIIGNGPSLLSTIGKQIDILQKNDCFMVNQSVDTDLFELIRPKYYVLADEYYFQDDDYLNLSRSAANKLLEKTKWEMTLLVPTFSKGSRLVNCVKENGNIGISYFSSLAPRGYDNIPIKRKFKYWDENNLLPLANTVLNTAASIAISMRFKSVFLVGADTSWSEMITVDQETNDLIFRDQHYYGETKRILSRFDSNKSNLAEQIDSIKKALEAYQVLKEYAYNNNCCLFNASEYSLIDCLERKKLSALKTME